MADWQVECPMRICLLAGHIYAATRMGMWGFNGRWELAFSTSVYQKELQNLLELSGCMDYLKSMESGCRTPVFQNDSTSFLLSSTAFPRSSRIGR